MHISIYKYNISIYRGMLCINVGLWVAVTFMSTCFFDDTCIYVFMCNGALFESDGH